MTRTQRLILSATMAALVALIVLSVAGSFMGAGRAGAMFNSPPMIVFWILLAWLFMAALVFFPRLLLKPGLAAMHVGALLVILGGMLGSQAGHSLLARRLGIEKVRAGMLMLAPGQSTRSVSVEDGGGAYEATLPFEVSLEQAWVEHYERAGLAVGRRAASPEWEPLAGVDGAGGDAEQEITWTAVPWSQVGVDIPFETGPIRVLQYLQSARAVHGPGVLHIRDANGRETELPAEAGQQVAMESPAMTVRVENVFRNLRPHRRMGMPPATQPGSAPASIAAAFEQEPVPGRPLNPAVEVSFTAADGYALRTLVFYRPRIHGKVPAGAGIDYDFPTLATAVADPNTHSPAMEVELGDPAHTRVWLIADPAWPQPVISLRPLLQSPVSPDQPSATNFLAADPPLLAMTQPVGPVKAYRATVKIMKDGAPVATKTLAVNDPLHYGGYDISLVSYQPSPEGPAVVMSVHSDTGLWLVYAGFALLVAGAAWQFWRRQIPRLKSQVPDEQQISSTKAEQIV